MDERIEKIVQHIKDHLYKSFSLEELAEMANLSPIYFHRLFKNHVGLTPRKFVEHQKIEAAHELLLSSKKQVQDIAIQFGYADYETFSRVYKKYFRVSPEDMRSIHFQATEDGKYKMIPIVSSSENEQDIIELIKNHPALVSLEDCEELDISVATCQKNEASNHPRSRRTKFNIKTSQSLSKKLNVLVRSL